MPAVLGASSPPLAWDNWAHVPGVYDVTGPLPDGRLALATFSGLELLDPASGGVTKPVPYAPDSGIEDYIAAGSGRTVADPDCVFAVGDVFALESKPPAVDVLNPDRGVFALWPIAGVDKLNGIAFDTSGRFGGRLLVAGPHAGATVIDAVDCRGHVTLVTDSAPRMEGGFAVAPPGFGPYGGDLIGVDEFSGTVYAIRAEGTVEQVATGLPAGSDLGPDSAGFVPPGFAAGGSAYLSDYDVGSGAHPGDGLVLRLSSRELTAAGVQEGDLLVADEGGGNTYLIHCSGATCSPPKLIAEAQALSHIEGHLLLVPTTPGAEPKPLPEATIGAAGKGGAYTFLPYAVGILILGAGVLLYWRQTRRR